MNSYFPQLKIYGSHNQSIHMWPVRNRENIGHAQCCSWSTPIREPSAKGVKPPRVRVNIKMPRTFSVRIAVAGDKPVNVRIVHERHDMSALVAENIARP